MSRYTHCSHGKAYTGEECPECDLIWWQGVKRDAEQALARAQRNIDRAAALLEKS